MSGILAFLVYLVAVAVPVYFLYTFHSQAWYWHLLATLAALAVGLVPTPPDWKTTGLDLVFGFCVTFLLVWGIGGLVTGRSHHAHWEKHA